MAIELRVPAVGESITEVEIGSWLKANGESVRKDEPVVTLESEKATVELPAPETGVLTQIVRQKGEVAKIGEVIAYMEKGTGPEPKSQRASAAEKPSAPKAAESAKEPVRVMPSAEQALQEHKLSADQIQATGPGGRLLKEDVLRHVGADKEPASAPPAAPPKPQAEAPVSSLGQPQSPPAPQPAGTASREEELVPMSRLRRTVAQRLVEAQHTAALLTTFNEVDMSQIIACRKEYGEGFQKRYGVKLGFMSFFIKACVDALKQFPALNAEVRGNSIAYHNYYDIGVAVGSGKGLVVPVLRNAEHMSFAEIESTIGDFGRRAKENKITLEELRGGTFTISNGGVYGSMLSTPIVNPPQSGVLGMHAIQERPVAREGAVVIRPMMFVALTYDHRIVDGREAVSFLKRIKEVIETPARMLLEI